MAGFSKIYCLGGLGGFMGADGLNPLQSQILVGNADRQWLEPRYFDKSLKPIGKINVIIPEEPNHPTMLLDACLAFFSTLFEGCPTIKKIQKGCTKMTRLDFDKGKNEIPSDWVNLRKEAEPIFKKIIIFEAELKIIDLSNFSLK